MSMYFGLPMWVMGTCKKKCKKKKKILKAMKI